MRGESGRFGAIAEIIPVFEYILNYYEQRVLTYKAVNYNAHEEAPEDHLAINTRAAWAKASDYYAKLDLSPARLINATTIKLIDYSLPSSTIQLYYSKTSIQAKLAMPA